MNTSTANISLSLKPSRVLIVSLGSVFLLALFSVLFLSIPIVVKIITVALILYMGIPVLKRDVFMSNDEAIIKVNCTNKGKVILETKSGEVLQAKIASAKWVFGYFVILLLQNNKRVKSLTIAKDSNHQEQFHALRLYLRSLST